MIQWWEKWSLINVAWVRFQAWLDAICEVILLFVLYYALRFLPSQQK